ncbi:MAG: ATP-binding cassette domain-containing protein [Chloroflexi bacterium]|nr:ATP-binding cassette domain-containing protein [Ardenticatenaceae bacterium]MBL1131425.1 ATP-binding cassette domain-containing protein [Chloroflexota bacterium]NOG37534.1 ATP-binding cassette domain-containing protein [Chloroflexota bacterium]
MLRLENLHQTFNAGQVNEVKALCGINLHLDAAEFVTIIGSNGAGKSTLFNAITGEFVPTNGRIFIDNIDVTKWPEYRRAAYIGRVFQNPYHGTAAQMTIAENMSLAWLRRQRLGLRYGVNRQRRQKLADLLAPIGLGLEDRLNDRVDLLSGGQRQAMTLLMASLTSPKLLLLDEHTAALDPATAVRILEVTQTVIAEQRFTTLMITRNMQQALTFGARTLMLHKGEVALDISQAERQGLTVQGLIDKFSEVKNEALMDDELLLSG